MFGWLSTRHLARTAAHNPWRVVAAWALLLVVTGTLATGINDVLTTRFALQTEPDSVRAAHFIEDRLRGPEQARELIIVHSPSLSIEDAQFERFVGGLLTDVRALKDVAGATSYYEAQDPSLISPDRHKTIIPVSLAGDVDEAADSVGSLVKLVERTSGQDGFSVLSAGRGSIDRAGNELSGRDAQRGEMIGIPIALVILLLVFGAAVAAGVPLLLGIVSIVVALGISALIGRAFELNFLVINIITMIGLAVGIDYALFIVQRFREERARGRDKLAAIEFAGATSGRAVAFSGGTVIVALLGMFIVPSNVYRSLAVGAIAVAAAAIASALTLLPAVLSILGDRVNALRIPFVGRSGVTASEGGFWDRVTRVVTARPLAAVAITGSALIALSVPYFGINPGLAGVSTFPKDEPVRRAFAVLEEDFSGGLIAPAEVVVVATDVRAPAIQGAVEELRHRLAADAAFSASAATLEMNDAGDLALLSVPLAGDPQADAAHDAIARLRRDYTPAAFDGVDAEVLVTGRTATEEDVIRTIARYTPWVFAFVLGLSFLLLLVVFRSVVVPAKALIMNLLSVGASYGLLVLVFQRGIGNEIFGFQQVDVIEAWLPLFLFSIVFGLSMDYHVFLLSRIRERFDETGDNAASIAYGLRTTAGLITGAALIMVAVFAGFALGEMSSLEQVGFGLAVAVILDATVVRTVLVPASMELLGEFNWYLPRWLNWLPNLRLEDNTLPPHAAQTPRAAAATD